MLRSRLATLRRSFLPARYPLVRASSTIPFMPATASPEDGKLVSELQELSKNSRKLVRSSEYASPEVPEIKVRSWKMNEFKYYQVPSPFPTLARGIYSTEVDGQQRIVARGYDKFFNVGEVPWTTWRALEENTSPPYTLSLKLNGCIIFVAALTPSKLLITSKHSIGPVQGVEESHAQAGERWLIKHLHSKGKTKEQLAAKLWEENLTAIAELCDDEFEEHVLPYPPEKSGLYLHGLNRSTKAFHTLLTTEVDAFAEEWGLVKTRTMTFDNVDAVKAFTDEAGKTGSWEGEAVEGFVVRTHVTEAKADASAKSKPPYPPGSTFFFKVKFDEPYMMYRDWREVTKSLLSAKESLSLAKLPQSKMKRPETRLYVKWVKREIEKDPEAFKDYTKGRGIIKTRERYLTWLETEEGKKGIVEVAKDKGVRNEKVFGQTIILPVAIPGCGKTTVAVALAKLFGFGHTQSDDVKAKKPAPVFIKSVTGLLESHNVVIADKNNHLKMHRQALHNLVSGRKTPVRLLALDWSNSVSSTPNSLSICSDRILLRGDAHQTLRADTSDAKDHEKVVRRFVADLEELKETEVDECINLGLEDTPEQALTKAVNGVVEVLGLKRPSEEQIKEALAASLAYAPVATDRKVNKKAKNKPEPRYYAFAPNVNLQEVIGQAFQNKGENECSLWTQLKENNRVAERPHITIVHKNALPGARELWDRCESVENLPNSLFVRIKLGALVWNERIMALTVEDLELEGQVGREFLSTLPDDVRLRLHITVGTRDSTVLPVEAGLLVERWKKEGDSEEVHSLRLDEVFTTGKIKGLFK